ncbi:SipW-dependent-type signal peptide-containing protein [Halorarius halobius]|uniref:SipW-dependent-type signal peptide-containing protein n=1 Tax=Halorarius halobius TaxID=2962671 RepID=UPI0020CFD92D|nr:SipW-dependent-type signal peptide-containing protein [Halorarius halobius]
MRPAGAELSRRELLAGVAGVAGASGIAGAGTTAAFTDTATTDGSFEAGTWIEKVAFGDGKLAVARDEAGTETFGVSGATVAGPPTDAFAGESEIPYTTGGGELGLVDDAGTRRTLNTGATTPRSSKSIVATGRWDGSPQSVFYTDPPAIYRVAPGESSPTQVASLGNGAKAVLGVVDIDSDGTDELVYVDGSAVARYLKPARNTEHKIGGFGANNQYGVGAPIRIPAGPRVPHIGGSGQVAVFEPDGTRVSLTPGSTAKKTSVAGRDVDGDGSLEIVFVDPNGYLEYIEKLDGKSTPKRIEDSAENPISVSEPAVGVH